MSETTAKAKRVRRDPEVTKALILDATEQLMLDEGYGRTAGTDPDHDVAFLKLRLGQLQDALLRNARFIQSGTAFPS